MFKGLLYFLGSIVFALVLSQKLYEVTGKHFSDIVAAVVRFVALVLKGGS